MDLINWAFNPTKWFRKDEQRPAGYVGIYRCDGGLALSHGVLVENEWEIKLCEFVEIPAAEHLQYATSWVQRHKLQKALCNFVLDTSQYELELLETPSVQLEELTEAVRWRVKDMVNIPIENAAVDILHLPEDAYRGRMTMLYAVVVDGEVIKETLKFIRATGLEPSVIDIKEMALRNIALYLPEMEHGTVALLNMYETNGSMLMYSHDALYLTRQIELGYSSFTTNQGAFSLDNGVMIERLALDIQRSLDYYESQLGKGIAQKIYVLPIEDENVHFEDDLQERLQTPILYFDCREFLPLAQGVSPNIAEQAFCLPVLGAVLRRASDAAG